MVFALLKLYTQSSEVCNHRVPEQRRSFSHEEKVTSDVISDLELSLDDVQRPPTIKFDPHGLGGSIVKGNWFILCTVKVRLLPAPRRLP